VDSKSDYFKNAWSKEENENRIKSIKYYGSYKIATKKQISRL
jgi:hypothetical protein